jgi:hypothetical protein
MNLPEQPFHRSIQAIISPSGKFSILKGNFGTDEISGLICFDLSIVCYIFVLKCVGSRPIWQTATVDHADMRGLVTT